MTPSAGRSFRRPDILRGAMAALALIGLAACGITGEDSGAAARRAAVATPVPAEPAKPQPAAAAPTAWQPATTPESTPASTAAPAEKHYPEPATLRGLDESQLSGLLGAPRFKRHDDPAQIWQYGDDACFLDVFLYKTGNNGPYTVLHFETRGRDQKPIDQNACFVSLLKAHDNGGAG